MVSAPEFDIPASRRANRSPTVSSECAVHPGRVLWSVSLRGVVVAGLALALSAVPRAGGNVLARNEGALRTSDHIYAEPGQVLEALQEQYQYPAAAPAPYSQPPAYQQPKPPAMPSIASIIGAAAGLGGNEEVGPPLVTQGSEEEAEEEFPGSAVDSLSHRHQIRLAALRRQQAVYGSTSPTIFVTSFLVMVASVIVLFYCAEKSWIARQQAVILD